MDEYNKRPNIKVLGILMSEMEDRVHVAYEYSFKETVQEGDMILCTPNLLLSDRTRMLCYETKQETMRVLKNSCWIKPNQLIGIVKEKWEDRLLNKLLEQTVEILHKDHGKLDTMEEIVWE